MTKGRLEAFSDGVLAIIITIMVLELKAPEGTDLAALRPLIPVLMSYVLSFIYVGIYWNNHHHLLNAVKRVNGRVLWANMHLLFWLSLTPFGTAWMGEHRFATWPVVIYGVILLFASIAYFILVQALLSANRDDSILATAVGRDRKGKISTGLYFAALPLAFVWAWLAVALYALVAVIWFIPDSRIERRISM